MGGGTTRASKPSSMSALPPRMYLVSDPEFVPRAINSTFLLLFLLACGQAAEPVRVAALSAYEWVKLQMLQAAHRMAWWSLLGLLSSSCCVIQVLLNCLSLGCSGINSILGPLRPHFIAVTAVTNAISIYVALQNPFQLPATAVGCALSVFLTFTPELLYLWTKSRLGPGLAVPGQATETSNSNIHVELKPGAMGCISCVAKVCKVVEKNAGVISSNVDFETATVSVQTANGTDAESIASSIEESLNGSNFPVASWRVKPSSTGAAVSEEQVASHAAEESSWMGSVWGFLEAMLAGLLGSSCCLVQLTVNVLTTLNVIHGVGCTGLNKSLGPLRPQLRCLTAAYMAWSWFLAVRRGWSKQELLLRTLLFAIVTFLPELLLLGGGPALAPPVEEVEVVTFKVDGMGCEACQAHVKGVIDGLGGVVASSVDFTTGMAEVHVARRWGATGEREFEVASLAQRLDEDGYFVAPEEAHTLPAAAALLAPHAEL